MTAPDFTHANWRKSSRSTTQDNCVEVAFLDWHKSTRSTDESNCVEVAYSAPCPHAAAEPAVVGVRDTKDRHGGTLTFTPTAWHTFLATQ